MNAEIAARSCCRSVSVVVEETDDTPVVSGGLPTMMGANEDATDDGTPAEVSTPTIDGLSSSGPGKVVREKSAVVDRDVIGDTVFG